MDRINVNNSDDPIDFDLCNDLAEMVDEALERAGIPSLAEEPLTELLDTLVDETRAQIAVNTAARRAELQVRIAQKIAEVQAA